MNRLSFKVINVILTFALIFGVFVWPSQQVNAATTTFTHTVIGNPTATSPLNGGAAVSSSIPLPNSITSIDNVTVNTGRIVSSNFNTTQRTLDVTLDDGKVFRSEMVYSNVSNPTDIKYDYCSSDRYCSGYLSAGYYDIRNEVAKVEARVRYSTSAPFSDWFTASKYGNDWGVSVNSVIGVESYTEAQFRYYRTVSHVYTYSYNVTITYSTNEPPVLQVYSTGDQVINLKNGSNSFSITGSVSDANHDNVTVSGSVGGVYKSITVGGTSSAQPWSLSWNTNELPAGTHSVSTITATDANGAQAAASYTGRVSVDKTPLYYWDKYTTKDTYERTIQRTYYPSSSYPEFPLRGHEYYELIDGKFEVRGNYVDKIVYGSVYQVKDYGKTLLHISTSGISVEVAEHKLVAKGKEKDTLVQPNIYDLDGTYPDNGIHHDGYWYVKKSNTNSYPILNVINEDKLIGLSTNGLKVRGNVSDQNNDHVLISATIGGVTKSITVGNTSTLQSWELAWGLADIGEGEYHNFQVIADDQKGGVSVQSFTGKLTVDKTAPTAPTLTYQPNWSKDPVEITAAPGTDNYGGVVTQYRINGSNPVWVNYNSPVRIQNEGITTVDFRSVDTVGNTGAIVTATVKIDTQPPSTPEIRLSEVGWTRNDVNFQITGSTDASAIRYEYSIDGGSFTAGDSGVISTSGQHKLAARAIDEVDNISAFKETTVYIDKIPPVITLSHNGRDWSPSGHKENVTITDNESNVLPAEKYFKVTNSASTPSSWDLLNGNEIEITEEGIWYTHLKATDLAGNESYLTSNPVKIQSLPKSPDIKVNSVGTNQVILTWELPSTFADGYEYTVRNTTTGAVKTVNYPVNSVQFNNLQGGEIYQFEIDVKNHVGSNSDTTTALTLPKAPENVTITKVNQVADQATLHFDGVKSADLYKIKVDTDYGMSIIDTSTHNTHFYMNGLIPGTFHNISITPVNASGEGDTATARFLSLPDTPGNFSAIGIFSNKIDLSWNSVTSATYYELERDSLPLFSGLLTSYSDVFLEPGTVYNYRLGAGNETGLGAYSELSNLITIPDQVGNTNVSDITTASSLVSWTGVKGVSNYNIHVSDGQRLTVSAATYAQNITGLKPGTNYTVTVQASNVSGIGVPSSVQFTTVPDPVPAIQVSDIEETTVKLSWPHVQGADFYRVQVGPNSFDVTTNEYVAYGLSGSSHYQITIQAGNLSGLSVPTTAALLTKPSSPSNLKITATSTDRIGLTWDKDLTAIEYLVVTPSGIVSVSDNYYVVENLQPGTDYDISVLTVNPTGTGNPSRIQWTTAPDVISNVNVNADLNEAIVEWDTTHGAVEYYIADKNNNLLYSGSVNQATISDLLPGTKYGFIIWSINKQGVISKKLDFEVLTKPDQPQLSFDHVTSSSIKIAVETKGIVDSYKIERDGKEIATLDGTKKHFVDNDVTSNKSYTYTFTPVNKSGQGLVTSISTVTSTLPVNMEQVVVKPGVYDAEISFELVDGAAQYVLVDSDNVEVWRGTESPIKLTGLGPNTPYTYSIYTENKEGWKSEETAIQFLTKPSKVKNVTATPGDKSISLHFVNDEKDIIFVVYRDNLKITELPGTAHVYTDAPLKTGTSYTYIIKTKNKAGMNEDAYEFEATTLPAEYRPVGSPSKPQTDSTPAVSGDTGLDTFFKDTDTTFSREEISYLAHRGIIKGTKPGIFEPNRQISRIEFAALIVRALEVSADESVKLTFMDINEGAWYKEELRAAISGGIAKGFSTEEFRPAVNINREQAAKMLTNVLLKNNAVDPSIEASIFKDAEEIIGWARDDVNISSSVGLIEGYPDGNFKPKNLLTRAEAAALIYRLMDMVIE